MLVDNDITDQGANKTGGLKLELDNFNIEYLAFDVRSTSRTKTSCAKHRDQSCCFYHQKSNILLKFEL